MTVVSRIAAPAGWLLDASTDLVFRLLGRAEAPEGRVTEDDVRALVAEAERTGATGVAERRMIAGVLRLGNRPVRGVMTPRGEVDWLDASAGEEAARAALTRTAHSRLPVGEGSPEAVIGVVQARELLAALLAGRPLDLCAAAHRAPVVPDTADALDVLAILSAAEVPMALVHDEHGNFEGVAKPTDCSGSPCRESAATTPRPASCWPLRAACRRPARRWRRRAGASRWWTSTAGGSTSCSPLRRALWSRPSQGSRGAARQGGVVSCVDGPLGARLK